MDSRITKKRLNDYIAYEWVIMIVAVVVCGFLWELFYGIASVKPTTGQEFKYYYDMGINTDNISRIHDFLVYEDAFSYDVLSNDYEIILEEFETLSLRLSVSEGDIIFTDGTTKDHDGNDKESVRAKFILDYYSAITYSLDELAKDGREYLATFLKDEVLAGMTSGGELVLDGTEMDHLNFEQNFDLDKIRAEFNQRLGKDNRFRKAEQKEEGVKQEINRIKKLCKDVSDFNYFLDNAPDTAFYRYTKYEQTYLSYLNKKGEEWYVEKYKPYYEAELKDRPNERYGINIGGLTGGRSKASEYFQAYASENANGVIMIAFDFKDDQPDLQYETISFMMTIIREFSNVVPA